MDEIKHGRTWIICLFNKWPFHLLVKRRGNHMPPAYIQPLGTIPFVITFVVHIWETSIVARLWISEQEDFFGNNNQTLVIMWEFHPFKGSWVKCSTNQKYTHTYTPFGHFSKRQRPPPYPSPIVHSCGVFNVLPNMIKIGLTYNPHETNWVEKEKGLWKGIISALPSSLSTHKSVFSKFVRFLQKIAMLKYIDPI